MAAVGLALQIRKPGKMHRRFLAFLCLAFLPPHMVEGTFVDCANEALDASALVSHPVQSIQSMTIVTFRKLRWIPLPLSVLLYALDYSNYEIMFRFSVPTSHQLHTDLLARDCRRL